MAAIAYDTLFSRLGSIGHIGYLLDGSQAPIPAALDAIVALYTGTADVDLIGSLLNQQPTLPNSIVNPVVQIQSIASSTLIRMVNASTPSVRTVQAALIELIRQMRLDSQTVKACAITATPAALSTNVGTGVLVLTTKRGDGLVQENTVAEVARVSCVADSYTGGTIAGQEQFQFTGQAQTAPLWNYNYPTGSAATTGQNAVSATQGGSTLGNILTNSDFETWSGPLSTDSLTSWVLQAGTYGTDIEQSSTAFAGTKSLRFLPTAANTAIYQGFGVDTPVTPMALTSYPINFWIRALAGTVSAGVLTVELVDGSSVVINDEQGVANSFTVTLNSTTTAWVAVNGSFRIPAAPPAVMRLRLRISTALVGDSILVDRLAQSAAAGSYPGGPGFVVFSGGTPFQAGDAFNATMTNARGGQSYLATFQSLFNRFFTMVTQVQSGLLLPSTSGYPTQPDDKITI